MANNEFDILIKFGLDDKGAKAALAEIKKLKAASDAATDGAKAGKGAADAFAAMAKGAAVAAAGMLSIGKAIRAATTAVNMYVSQAGASEEISKRWLEATQEIEFAQVRVGREIATNVIPYLEKAAELAGIVADMMTGGVEGPVAPMDANNPMAQAAYNYAQAKGLLPKDRAGRGYSSRYLDSENPDARMITPAPGDTTDLSILMARRNYQIQALEAEKSYENQKFKLQRDFDRQELYAEQDFGKQRGRTLRDFSIQYQYAESEFYRNRTIALRDFNIGLQRNEYDYQLSRKRAQEDQNFSLKQIMLSGDALAYYYSQRQFNITKKRAEEDYQLQKSRSAEDFQRGRSDQMVQFEIARSFQRKQFSISLGDQNEDFRIQRKRAKEGYRIQRNDADYARYEQIRLMRNSYQRQFEQAQTGEAQLLSLKNSFTSAEVESFIKMETVGRQMIYETGIYLGQMQQALGLGGSGGFGQGQGYAKGGYTRPGPAIVHAGEFVLTADTTKAAERMAQSNRLTQNAILGAMTGGGMVYHDNREFSRGLAPDERIMIRNELRQMVAEAFRL